MKTQFAIRCDVPVSPDAEWLALPVYAKRKALHESATRAVVRDSYSGTRYTTDELYDEVHVAIDQSHIPEPDSGYFVEDRDEMLREIVRLAKARAKGKKSRIVCIYRLSKRGVPGFHVGRTRNLSGRLAKHLSRHGHLGVVNHGLARSVRETGAYDSVTGYRVEVLEYCESCDIEFMREREQSWIDKLEPTWNQRNELPLPR